MTQQPRYYQYRILAPTYVDAWLANQQMELIKLIFGDTAGITITSHEARIKDHSLTYINIQARQKGD